MVAILGACGGDQDCPECNTLVIAAVGEPASIFPPLVMETVGRDISDQVFERLADLETGQPTVDESAYAPRLARGWERVDSLTLRFNLRDGAEWHDGTPVTAEDVVYSFQVFRSPEVDALARSQLENRVASVTAEDSTTVLVKFTRAYPEQMYDATYHVRIIPAHIWRDIPVADWPGDTSLAHLVGTGPYRVSRWQRGQSLELVEVESEDGITTEIPRVIWRFADDPQAAFNLIASHDADILESLTMDMVERLASDTAYRLLPYPSAVYGFLGFRVADDRGRPTPILGDRSVRRALAAAIDRRSLARAVYGPETRVPSGPYSQLLWVGAGDRVQPQWDSTAAAAMLDRQGWQPGADGVRRKSGVRLEVAIMVPSTSGGRVRMAEIIQEQWRRIGVSAGITAVDFPVFQTRLAQGNFESYIGAWLDEPSPRGLGDQWTREAWDALNYGHYENPAFDSLFRSALAIQDVSAARPVWKAAFDTLRADASAVFLYAPTNIAAVANRVQDVRIDPFSWLANLPEWSLADERRVPLVDDSQ